jgi:isochorismate synthase
LFAGNNYHPDAIPNHQEMNNPIDVQLNSRISRNDRFAIYRLPGESHCTLVDLSPPKPFSFSQFDESQIAEGFVVCPFDGQQTSGWWFPTAELWPISINSAIESDGYNPIISNEFDAVRHGFEQYANQFSMLMESISKGEVKKVILSRIIEIDINLQQKLSRLFQLLCRQNPAAFVYLIVTPETGAWMGASPELLLSKRGKEFTTVSLAGTRNLNEMDPGQWNTKEIEEQNVVSNFIDRLMESYNIGTFKKSGPAITRAGSVTHLKTTYHFTADGINGTLGSFIKAMHPTPALGGEPKDAAMALIRKVEKHNRSYYGGFIGPVSDKEINLFVNIRCMKIEAEKIKIYTGGGLTSDSDLHQEWNETILKSQTLLAAINNL